MPYTTDLKLYITDWEESDGSLDAIRDIIRKHFYTVRLHVDMDIDTVNDPDDLVRAAGTVTYYRVKKAMKSI